MDDTAKEFDDSEEKVKYDLSSTVMDLDENGHVSKLRNARKGKLAHLTKRKKQDEGTYGRCYMCARSESKFEQICASPG